MRDALPSAVPPRWGRDRPVAPGRAPARWVAAVLCAFAVAVPSPAALAAAPTSAEREQARAEGAAALTLMEQEDYAGALAKLDLAYQLVPTPALGLHAARCLVKLGRLVEASERYLQASRFPLDAKAPPPHAQAATQARAELDALQPQIPTVTVTVPGKDQRGLRLSVDGEQVPDALVGQPQPLDPGRHRIDVQLDELHYESEVVVGVGDKTKLLLQLPAAPAVGSAAPTSRPSPLRDWGIVALSIGGCGASVGALNGALAVVQQQSLEARCPDHACPPGEHAAADRYDAMRALTTAGLVVGAVGLALGATLLLVVPDDAGPERPASRASLRLGVGWAAIGLGGAF